MPGQVRPAYLDGFVGLSIILQGAQKTLVFRLVRMLLAALIPVLRYFQATEMAQEVGADPLDALEMKQFANHRVPTNPAEIAGSFSTRKAICGATLAFLVANPLNSSADPGITASVRELVSDYSWGYSSGLKQPQGSYLDGRSVYSVSRRTRTGSIPKQPPLGTHDALVWVDERDGTNITTLALTSPKGFNGEGVNPGGNIVFSSGASPENRGDMWWVSGARAEEVPFDLSRSLRPYNPRKFRVVLNDFEKTQRSTAPTLSVSGNSGLVVYRYLHSTRPDGAVVFRGYNLGSATPVLEQEGTIGLASPAPGFGTVTIEQVWSRWDPRKMAVAATWQWYWRTQAGGKIVKRFGSNPFVFTEDFGITWRLADGSAIEAPLTYATQTATTTPYDHLSRRESANWFTRDVGFGIEGNPWMTVPVGNAAKEIRFFFWSGSSWDSRPLTLDVDQGDPIGCGTTRDYVVCAFSERRKAGSLLVRVSRDDGRTWSSPVQVDNVFNAHGASGNRINVVSFVQPADDYSDNSARFFYGYYKQANGGDGRNYRNNIRWVKLQIQ